MTTPAPAASIEDLTAYLASLPDERIAALLTTRPDLIAPPASSLGALAARAASRPSVELALAGADAPALGVAQAVVAGYSSDAPALAGLLGLTESDAAARLTWLRDHALLVPSRPARPEPGQSEPGQPSVADRQAAGVEEPVPGQSASRRADSRGGVDHSQAAELAPVDGLAPANDLAPVDGLAQAFGPAPRVPEPLASPDPADLEVLPAAQVADTAARHAEETVRLVSVLLAEWGREGGAILRHGGVGVRVLARTAQALELEPFQAASVIELAAQADLLGLDEDGATWVPSSEAGAWREDGLEAAWAALVVAWVESVRTPWLVGSRGDDGSLRPVLGEDVEAAWAGGLRRRLLALAASLPEGTALTPAWARTALAWSRPRRQPPEGAVTAVLAEMEALGLTGGGALSRGGRVLAAALAGGRREPARVARAVVSRPLTSRAHQADGKPQPDPADAAAFAPSAASAGSDADGSGADPVLPLPLALEQALAADLPAPVDMLLVQSDLTAIVPGRPVPELSRLLESASQVESRGGALTVRFTPESVRGAMDAGMDGQALLAALSRYSPSPLPATLEALVADVARRFGAVRVREVASVLRVPDPATAAGLVADSRLAELGLTELAPGILASSAPAGTVLRLLRETGLAPVLEDSSGALLLAGDVVRRRSLTSAHGAPEPARPGAAGGAARAAHGSGEAAGGGVRRRRPTTRDLSGLVRRLREGEAARRASGEGTQAPATDPVHSLALLRQAKASREPVRIRVALPGGQVQARRVRVVAVEPGRVRLADLDRETELTVAVHRIVSVAEE